MMMWLGRKSPKWRQFCDRKRIGFSRPITQRWKRIRRTERPLKTPERDLNKKSRPLAPASNNEPYLYQLFVRTKTLIRWYRSSETIVARAVKQREEERRQCLSMIESQPDQEDTNRGYFVTQRSAFVTDTRVIFLKDATFVSFETLERMHLHDNLQLYVHIIVIVARKYFKKLLNLCNARTNAQ